MTVSTMQTNDVLVLQHIGCEPLGIIEDTLRVAGLPFRYVRGYAGEVVPPEIGNAPALIVMGGPMGAYESERYPFLHSELRLIENAVAHDVPVLGVCLGSQLLATALGASVHPGTRPEIGWLPVTRTPAGKADPLWSVLPPQFAPLHWHGDMFDAPLGTQTLASSALTPCQAFRHGDCTYGVLFHMEVTKVMVREWTAAFAEEVQNAGAEAAHILDALPARLPAAQEAGQAFYGAWAQRVAAHLHASGSRPVLGSM